MTSHFPNGEGEAWYRWTPEAAKDPGRAFLAAAINDFEPLDNPAGRAAATWLKTESLQAHGSVVTYLLMIGERLQGFYAITGSQVRLTQRQRHNALPSATASRLAPTQPASLVTFMARHRDAQVPGRLLLLHAASTALKVSEYQGNIALVIDAFDETTAMALQRYGFRRAAQEDGRTPRLWLPLHLPSEAGLR